MLPSAIPLSTPPLVHHGLSATSAPATTPPATSPVTPPTISIDIQPASPQITTPPALPTAPLTGISIDSPVALSASQPSTLTSLEQPQPSFVSPQHESELNVKGLSQELPGSGEKDKAVSIGVIASCTSE